MSRIIIDAKKYKDIPFCEYYLDNQKSKGLVFVQHGFQSTKEYGADYLALTLARLGYKVISIDAYKHGERIEEPYISKSEALRYAEIFHVVDHSANDIITLFEDLYSNEYELFDMIGVSMGGFIAYSVAIRTDKINKLVPVITTPMFLKLANTRYDVPNIEAYYEYVKEHLPYIEELDVYSQFEKLRYQQMMIINGEKDPIIPLEHSVEFFNLIKCAKVKMEIYDEVHEVNRMMQKAIFDFIQS